MATLKSANNPTMDVRRYVADHERGIWDAQQAEFDRGRNGARLRLAPGFWHCPDMLDAGAAVVVSSTDLPPSLYRKLGPCSMVCIERDGTLNVVSYTGDRHPGFRRRDGTLVDTTTP